MSFAGTGTPVGGQGRKNPRIYWEIRLEARVGIGRLMPCFRQKTTPFSAQFQYNLALFGLAWLNALTEDFIEGFLAFPALMGLGFDFTKQRGAVVVSGAGRNTQELPRLH